MENFMHENLIQSHRWRRCGPQIWLLRSEATFAAGRSGRNLRNPCRQFRGWWRVGALKVLATRDTHGSDARAFLSAYW